MALLNGIAAAISATRSELFWTKLLSISGDIGDAILTEDNQSFMIIETPWEGDLVYYLQTEN